MLEANIGRARRRPPNRRRRLRPCPRSPSWNCLTAKQEEGEEIVFGV